MGKIPQHFIDDLLARTDIVSVIEPHLALRKAGRDFQARCPFHEEKTPSFTVSPAKQFYHCFGCGAHGTAVGFLMEHERLGFVEAIEELARRAGVEVPREGGDAPAAPRPDYEPLLGVLEQASAWFRRQLRDHPAAGRAVDYLKGRGLTGQVAQAFGIGFAPPGWNGLLEALATTDELRERLLAVGLLVPKDDGGAYDRFRNRVVFPIRDRRGRVIGFGARVLDPEDQPKYLNSPESPVFHKGRELYGLYEAQQALRSIERMVVVEGYMDVVALAQHGVHEACATLGTSTTPEHVERLFRVTGDVVFCFDGDKAGRKAAWRALENTLPQVREGRQARFLFLPEGEDPDTLVRKEGEAGFRRRMDDALTLSEFMFKGLTVKLDLDRLDDRALLVERAKPLIAGARDDVYRHLLLTRLAELTRLGVGELGSLLKTGGPAPARGSPPPPPRRRPARAAPPALADTALALLLQNPALAELAGDPDRWAGIPSPAVDRLGAVLADLREHPAPHLAAVLERWRERPEAEALSDLARLRADAPPEGLETEFRDALGRLDAAAETQRARELLGRPLASLSEEEKTLLRQHRAATSKNSD